ncbi:MAG TPA: protein kinase [Vicinamibacterales bacterium]|nr:protein kinase [Vicinamibacterales bacterium]
MPLSAGTRIGAYEVTGAIGAGGMGEVYRARDHKLNRDVAIKVLPDLVANDPDRVARFTREAQLLAALNHPNIAQIHGLEQIKEGHALVMELVEGEDLSAQISRGGLSPADALAIARQIASALEAAHEQGIIHRDLKPGNVKVRADGAVKVLDFGLAKALTADTTSGASEAMNSPTLTARATQLGVILGTAAYMSPEQAKGKPVDKRADIWAFGAVLYEMLAGRRAFAGEDISETLAAVLTREPDLASLPKTTPPALTTLIRRCLERDTKRRLRDIGEARLVLEDPAVLAPPVAGPVTVAAGRAPVAWRVATAGLALALIAVGLLWWTSNRQDATPVRMSIVPAKTVTFDLTIHPSVAVSRDGSMVAFVGLDGGIRRLYVRRMDDFEARPLEGTVGAAAPFFRPDGSWIGFFAAGKLMKIQTAGGPAIPLADVVDNRGGVWTDADTIVYAPNAATPIFEVPAAGGTPRQVSKLNADGKERTHRWPAMLPDGKTALVTVGSVERPDDYDEARIEAVNLSTGDRKVVIKAGRTARYARTGHLLFVRGKILYAVPFNPTTLIAGESPTPVVDGISGDVTTGSANYAVADWGALVTIPGDPSGSDKRLSWADKQKKLTPVDVPAAIYTDPHLAPDGRRVAVAISSGASNLDLHVIDTLRGTSTKLTSGGSNRTPLWSADGLRLIYVSYDRIRNVSKVMKRLADGTGEPETINEIAGQAYADDLTKDGGTLIFTVNASIAGARAEVFSIALQKGSKPVLVANSPAGDVSVSSLSPDGNWIAYGSFAVGQPQVFVQAYPGGGGRTQVSSAGGQEPRWSPDGRALYYVDTAGTLMEVPLEPGKVFSPGKPQPILNNMAFSSTDSGQTYSVSKDGRFLMLRASREGGLQPEIRVIQNVFSQLKSIR